MMPTPDEFLTEDFKCYFGDSIPNCSVTSTRENCTAIQLWHEAKEYLAECWQPAVAQTYYELQEP